MSVASNLLPPRIRRRKQENEYVKFRLNMYLTMLLLGLLMSYNLDVECMFVDGTACQQICQEAAADVCADPSYGSHYVVAIPVRPSVFEAYLIESPIWLSPVLREPPPSGPGIDFPTRLRAPPLVCVS